MPSDSPAATELAAFAPPSPEPGTSLPVHGALAAANERLVSLAAASVRASFAFIILTGNDRRSFGAGPGLPDWVSHDSGAFWRSGIGELISQGPVMLRDRGQAAVVAGLATFDATKPS